MTVQLIAGLGTGKVGITVRVMKKLWMISIIYLPIAIAVGALYGLFCGIVGSTLGSFEFFLYQSREQYRLWKRFPDASQALWEQKSISARRDEKLSKNAWTTEEKHKDKDPHFFIHVLLYAVWGIGLWPFKVVFGLVMGPILGVLYGIDHWQEVILKRSAKDRIEYQFKTNMEGELSWISQEK